MARTIRPAAISHDRGLLVLVTLAGVTAGLMAFAKWDAPVAEAAPTPNGYALVQDVNTATFNRMVDFAMIPGTNNTEAIVVSQTDEKIYRVSPATPPAFMPTEYGDLTSYVGGTGNEEGLLSATFSPNFVSDHRIYVYYTQGGDLGLPTVLSRFQVSGNAMITSSGSETRILEVPDFASNHNGGRLLFGPDGYLYLSLGDGGGGGDPAETGQNNTDLLGSVLRINVTGQATYTIPTDNPFVGVAGADEVWAYGLRNPWRFSFDRLGGDLWLADVGQGAWEEVEEIAKGGNYGWDCYEGNAVFETAGCSTPPSPFIFPRAVYDLGLGCSVTGGYIFRGPLLHEIYGWYVYGDYCSGRIWAVNPADTSGPVLLVDTPQNISSFGELPNGELLVLTFSNAIYRLTCAATPDTDGDGQGNACDLDDDNDSFPDSIEEHTGTNVLQSCSADATPNNEAVDARPTDLNDDRSVTGADLSTVAGVIGSAVPPAPARRDIAPDPVGDNSITGADLSRIAGAIGTSC